MRAPPGPSNFNLITKNKKKQVNQTLISLILQDLAPVTGISLVIHNFLF